MLVVVPALAIVATAVQFVVFAVTRDPDWARGAFIANVVAVAGAMIVAVPGLVDFLAIPASHVAKRLGVGHMVLNVASLLLLTANLLAHVEVMRGLFDERADGYHWYRPAVAVLLTLSAAVLTSVAGALGVGMARRYHVGEPRRTSAGGGGPSAPTHPVVP